LIVAGIDNDKRRGATTGASESSTQEPQLCAELIEGFGARTGASVSEVEQSRGEGGRRAKQVVFWRRQR
jgi:hypothetical protein